MSKDNQNGYVRVMRSHDYNQFEVCLPILASGNHNWHSEVDHALYLQHVDDRRKEAARLVDKAVEQYSNMMVAESLRKKISDSEQVVHDEETKAALAINPDKRTARQKALVRIVWQSEWLLKHQHGYDYEDDAPDFDDPQNPQF